MARRTRKASSRRSTKRRVTKRSTKRTTKRSSRKSSRHLTPYGKAYKTIRAVDIPRGQNVVVSCSGNAQDLQVFQKTMQDWPFHATGNHSQYTIDGLGLAVRNSLWDGFRLAGYKWDSTYGTSIYDHGLRNDWHLSSPAGSTVTINFTPM